MEDSHPILQPCLAHGMRASKSEHKMMWIPALMVMDPKALMVIC